MESVAPSSCLTSDVEGDYGRQGNEVEYPAVVSPQASTGWAQPSEAVPAGVGSVMKRSENENVKWATAPIAAVRTQEEEDSGGVATFGEGSRGFKGFKELKEMYLREKAVLSPVLEGDEEEELSTIESKEQSVEAVSSPGEDETVVSQGENPETKDVAKEEQCSSVVSSVLTKTVQVDAKVAEVSEIARGIATPTSPERGFEAESGADRDVKPRATPVERVDEKTTVGENETGPSEAEPAPKPRCEQLFTDEELDAWERGEPFPAEEELEEFDKELEDRLIPLDEVELQRRVKKNAEGQRPLTTGEQSELLGIPEEVLERTKQASRDGHGQPEFWLTWYEKTLAHTEEAKRANRDFKKAVAGMVSPVRTQQADKGAGSAPRVDARQSGDARDEGGTAARRPPSVDEGIVRENVLVTLDGKSCGVPEDVVSSVLWWRPDKRWRTVARKIVYKLACEDGELETKKGALNEEVPPERDKAGTVAFNWRRAAALAKDSGLIAGTPLYSRVLKFAEGVYRKTARKIKRKRFERRNGAEALLTRARTGGVPVKKVHFDSSVPRDDSSESLDGGMRSRPGDDDSPVEMQIVQNGDEPTEWSRPGLVEALEVGDEDVAEATRLKSERVICSIGPACQKGVEAVSTGYLEDYPAELLIDSGAVASLVDLRMLKLLGQGNATLRPYEGGLNSVTGSPLHSKV